MDYVPEYYGKRVIIFGCGNILFGDDGFGLAVAKYIQSNRKIPDDVYVMDVGTGIRDILFNLILSEKRPEKIIVVDAIDRGKKPGEVFQISIEEYPEEKIDDFSLHQVPSSNMLRELRDLCGVEVIVIACQVEHIPEEVEPGLTETVKKAIPKASKLVMERL
ncbi:MAG: coenzyme F420-reducing hydrogenase, FrhD protein [Candidatus Hydrothermarchaeales archaeon]